MRFKLEKTLIEAIKNKSYKSNDERINNKIENDLKQGHKVMVFFLLDQSKYMTALAILEHRENKTNGFKLDFVVIKDVKKEFFNCIKQDNSQVLYCYDGTEVLYNNALKMLEIIQMNQEIGSILEEINWMNEWSII